MQVQASGGGRYDLFVDGRELAANALAKALPVAVRLTPGDHGILVHNAGGAISIEAVTCR